MKRYVGRIWEYLANHNSELIYWNPITTCFVVWIGKYCDWAKFCCSFAEKGGNGCFDVIHGSVDKLSYKRTIVSTFTWHIPRALKKGGIILISSYTGVKTSACAINPWNYEPKNNIRVQNALWSRLYRFWTIYFSCPWKCNKWDLYHAMCDITNSLNVLRLENLTEHIKFKVAYSVPWQKWFSLLCIHLIKLCRFALLQHWQSKDTKEKTFVIILNIIRLKKKSVVSTRVVSCPLKISWEHIIPLHTTKSSENTKHNDSHWNFKRDFIYIRLRRAI
jgi:hypothetical protein